jgi:hypothetical protein
MIYTIYHPIDGSLNHHCKPGVYMYEKVYSLEADSLEEAFRLSQNDFNEDYALLGCRSTSVGDIIQSQEDWDNQCCHIVKGIGFQNVPNTWLTYIDWGFAPIPNDGIVTYE